MCNQPYIFILTPGPKVNRVKSHPQQIKVQQRPNCNKYMQSDHYAGFHKIIKACFAGF